MDHIQASGHFRRALEDGDVMSLWTIWSQAMPHLPQPKTEQEAAVIMHVARTESESMPDAKRAYSHKWLLDRGLPSHLPDRLKPLADRLYPRIVDAVGISVNMPKFLLGAAQEVEKSMSDAVEEVHADGVDLNNRPVVWGKMFDARKKTLKGLGF